MSEAWRKETDKLHDRITDGFAAVGKDISDIKTDVAVIRVRLDTLIKTNSKSGGGITKGQLALACVFITGLFGVITAMIRWWA